MKRIRVAYADDQIYILEGLCKILQETIDMEDAGRTQKLSELLSMVLKTDPDILILDLEWQGDLEAGIRLMPEILQYKPNLPIIALTAHPQLHDQARKAGAYPFSKNFAKSEFLDFIRHVVAHHEPSKRQPGHELCPLSPREVEVLGLAAKGKTNHDIASLLIIDEGTVKKHISSIIDKLQVNNRTEASVKAAKNGWI
jgi:DNA-binding NarL/FixJ family response regulator